MYRIQNTIALARDSWHALQADKELLLLPVLSGIASLLVALTFLVPLAATGRLGENDSGGIDLAGFVVLFVGYVALSFVVIFFNAALIHAANERMEGGDPTIGSALAGAWQRAGRILPWAIVSATVSVVLRSIQERVGFIGQIVVGLIGIAWSLVTFLVLPSLVINDVGVIDAVKESGRLFRSTWGENVVARASFGLLGFLAVLAAIPIVVLTVALGGPFAVVGIAAFVVWMILVAVVLTALNAIYQTALYRFAVGRPTSFGEQALQRAFGPKG